MPFPRQPILFTGRVPHNAYKTVEGNICILDEVGTLFGKKYYRTCTPRPGGSGLLQHIFYRSEERRRLTLRQLNTHLIIPHFKIKTLRSIMKSIVPGGWTSTSSQKVSGSSTVSEVSQVLCGRNSLPVQSNAFRSCDSSTLIYKGNVDSRELPPKTANIHSHVSGRLASETSRPLFAHSTQNHNHRSSVTRQGCKVIKLVN